MGKSAKKSAKKGWKKADAEEVIDHLETGGAVEAPQSKAEDLFFIDKTGNTNSRRQLKRKQKLDEVQESKRQAQGGKTKTTPSTPSTTTTTTEVVEKKKATPKKQQHETTPKTKFSMKSKRLKRQGKGKGGKEGEEEEGKADPLLVADTALVAVRTAAHLDMWEKDEAEKELKNHMVENNLGYKVDVTTVLRPEKRRHVEKANQHITSLKLQLEHPGSSINPDPESHQELILKAFAIDQLEKKEKLVMHDHMNALRAHAKALALKRAEHPDEDEEDEETAEGHKETRKLTKAERNKQQRRKQREEEQGKKKKEKELVKQINSMPTLIKEMKKEEKEREEHKQRVQELKETNPNKPLKLGKLSAPESFPEVALTEDLESSKASLLQVKASRHVVKEQFMSFQQRHLLETRRRTKTKLRKNAHMFMKNKNWENWTNLGASLAALGGK